MEIYLIVLNSENYSARESVNSNAKLVRFYRSVADDLLRDLQSKFYKKYLNYKNKNKLKNGFFLLILSFNFFL